MSAVETNLYGTHPTLTASEKPYESPDEYDGQGDTRRIRNLQFSYLAATGTNPDGSPVLTPVDIPQNTVVNIDDIGLLALKRGEEHHEFFTTRERETFEKTGTPMEPPTAETNISDLGAHELAIWLAEGKDGGPWTIDEVLERVGQDKDLANRMLEAENVRSDGDARKGLEAGLTAIIQEA